MSRRSAFENMGTGFPVWSWFLQEPVNHEDQLKQEKKARLKYLEIFLRYQSAFLTVDGKK